MLTGNIIVQHEHLETGGNSVISKEVDTPERKAGFKAIADRCKQDGALAIAQLSHVRRFNSGKDFSVHSGLYLIFYTLL